MAFNNILSVVMRPILDAMQTMPSTFVYLIPVIFFFPLGNVPAVIATIIYAMPPVMRLTELAIRNVDKEVVESIRSIIRFFNNANADKSTIATSASNNYGRR